MHDGSGDVHGIDDAEYAALMGTLQKCRNIASKTSDGRCRPMGVALTDKEDLEMAERSFVGRREVRLGAGKNSGAGILAITKARCKRRWLCRRLPGAPISHRWTCADAPDIWASSVHLSKPGGDSHRHAGAQCTIRTRAAPKVDRRTNSPRRKDNRASAGSGRCVDHRREDTERLSIMQSSHAFAMKSRSVLDPRPKLPSIVKAVAAV